MAILLDNRILSAPNLNQPISNDGVITGNFTRAEAEFLQKILQSGSLPAALNKVPISENQVGAELGRDAVTRGLLASALGWWRRRCSCLSITDSQASWLVFRWRLTCC